ncbi:hypothetical protein ECP030529315_0761 [Escherichia coli p0305293.15]|nr:hypothetical protein ECP030529315_0761 [Escherichia coli p0305293.15]
MSLLTVEDPHNAAVFCRNRSVICAFTSGCAALAFSPSVAGTTSVTSAAKQWLKQLLIESLWSFALLRDGI